MDELVKEQINELKKNSKPLHELVVSEKFLVEDVISDSYSTHFTPTSEIVCGGVSSSYRGGDVSNLIIKVSTFDMTDINNHPTKILHFKGTSIVKVNDIIITKIPRYERKDIRDGFFNNQQMDLEEWNKFFNNQRIFYLDRKFKEEEEAIELKVHSRDRTYLRTDRAVNYDDFQKK